MSRLTVQGADPDNSAMRSDDDQWDVRSSVGKTAIALAQGRALEALADDPLIVDEYAASFLRAAGEEVPTVAAGSAALAFVTLIVSVRARFFDDYLLSASAAGIRQVVSLAVGLDSRAYRMPWPADLALYEIDQPAVMDFKDRVLTDVGAVPSCVRHPIGMDLRNDWVSALQASGFDTTRPTAWLIEGLTPYLTAAALRQLFERFASLSAPGSWLGIDVAGSAMLSSATRDDALRTIESEFEVDIDEITYPESHFDHEAWLAQHGWTLETETLTSIAGRYGRPLPEGLAGLAADYPFTIAHLAAD